MKKSYVILFMIVVTTLATTAMTGVKLLLNERIKRNAALAENRLRLEAFGLLPKDATPEDVARIYGARVREEARDGHTIYVAYADDARQTIMAYGFPWQASGLWGPFDGLLALDSGQKTIVGFVVMNHQETPGLGARMTEPQYRAQFKGKRIDAPDAQGRYLVFVPASNEPKTDREVNAITGATITTNGLNRMFKSRSGGDSRPETEDGIRNHGAAGDIP